MQQRHSDKPQQSFPRGLVARLYAAQANVMVAQRDARNVRRRNSKLVFAT